MISVTSFLEPFLGSAQPSRKSPSAVAGARRLLDDLQGLVDLDDRPSLPAASRASVLERVFSEPARVVTDLHGRIVETNPAFSALCGYSFAEIRGRKPGTFLQGNATEATEVDRIRRAVALREPVTACLTNYHKNGTPYRVRIEIQPLREPSGRVTGFRATETMLG